MTATLDSSLALNRPFDLVHVQNVSKLYPLCRRPPDRLRELLPFAFEPLRTDFRAVRGITFAFEKGEVRGLVEPTEGRVVKRGPIGALLDLGSFHPDQELEDFQFECSLTAQPYTLAVAAQNANESGHGWLDDVVAFGVVDTRPAAGVYNLRARVTWHASR